MNIRKKIYFKNDQWYLKYYNYIFLSVVSSVRILPKMSKDLSCFWWDFVYYSWVLELGLLGFFAALGVASFALWAIKLEALGIILCSLLLIF
ncbi:hypothetical protein [Campylobacter devanensis]|uniref:hypothetical protein n=1 Tax=Campylobacter devanensis TaxID=3161138 RepID=UPI000A347CF3|nr:hypothetical protein [Campylobacter sp. P090]